MNQIKISKDLDSERKRIFFSKLKLSNGCSSVTPPTPPRVNLESFSLHRLHQMHSTVTANPNPDDLKETRKLEASLSNVENQEKGILHNILQSFTKSQLVEILQEAAIAHPTILHTVLSIVDDDPSHRKIFIRNLGPKTTPENLHNFFSNYGEVEEAKVIFDRATGYSKGYGFVTFKNVESLFLALENPSKKIDGFVSFTSICVGSEHSSSWKTENSSNSTDEMEKMRTKRKIRVENVPAEMSSETLLSFFEKYGEIEEGPWGFDMGTGKSRGFAYLLYKNEESAKAALAERVKFVDGFRLVCKMVLREREKSNRNPTGLVEPLPSPPRTLVLPVSYYYCVYYSRRLVPYNYYYQNELVMGGSRGQLGPGTQGQSSSALPPAPRIAGAANSGASPSGR